MSPSTPTPSPTASPAVGSHAIRPLTLPEARVLSTLMEKARTVPDTYPMTLNGLLSGCNQKTSREPVMNLSEAEVLEALDGLRDLHLISESSGGRAARFGHQFQRAYGVPEQSAVLLGLLMLRGPQTAGELRLNAERWYRFADISSVEGFLDELQERSEAKGGALVLKLPRAPGAREQRWAHLLCGPFDEDSLAQGGVFGGAMQGAHAGGLAQRVLALESEVAQLRAALARVCAELGMPAPDGATDHAPE